MNAWILASRPKTLPAAAVPVWVGSLPALVDAPSTESWLLLFSALTACLCIQIATNFFNDAIDSIRGADTSARLGPTRVTASGLLSRRGVLLTAFGFCVAAAVIALPIVFLRGWPILLIGSVSLFLAYCYTGGPFPLAYHGMGEIFVILFFGFVAVSGSHYVQTATWGGLPILVLGLQCGLYSSALLAINNLRDRAEDLSTGKRTLAVQLGESFARWEIAGFCFVPLLLWIVATPGINIFIALLPPLAGIPVVAGVFLMTPGRAYNKLLALSALQLILFAVATTWYFLSQ